MSGRAMKAAGRQVASVGCRESTDVTERAVGRAEKAPKVAQRRGHDLALSVAEYVNGVRMQPHHSRLPSRPKKKWRRTRPQIGHLSQQTIGQLNGCQRDKKNTRK